MLNARQLDEVSLVVTKGLQERDLILEKGGGVICSEISNEKELHKGSVSDILGLTQNNEKVIEIVSGYKYVLLEVGNGKFYLYDKASKKINKYLEVLTNFSFTDSLFKRFSGDTLVLIKTISGEGIFSLNKGELKIDFYNIFRIEDYRETLIAWIKMDESDLIHSPYCLENGEFLDINTLIEQEENVPVLREIVKPVVTTSIKPIPKPINHGHHSNPVVNDIDYEAKCGLKSKPDGVEHIVLSIQSRDGVTLTDDQKRILDGACSGK